MELHGGHAERLVARLAVLVEVVFPELDHDVLSPEGLQAVRRRQHVVIADQGGAAILA